MKYMNMPGFTAGASLFKTSAHYQREATDRVDHRGSEVLAQSKAEAQHVVDVLKIGAVHCDWIEYCEGHMPNIRCGIREVCYWWPW